MELTMGKGATERPSDDSRPFGPFDHGVMVDMHWEITIEHWVRDDESRLNRLRWFVWNLVGIGDPPSRAQIASASEVTTVTADRVPLQMNQPNRRLVKVVPHSGSVSTEEIDPSAVLSRQ